MGLRSAHRPRNVRHRLRLREVMRVLPVAGPQQVVPRRQTSSTELHWNSPQDDSTHQKSGHHGWAVVGRDLGDRDWEAIDPQPLRRSKGVRFRFTPSLYFWKPTGTHVWCESQEERWEVLWLEFSGQVEKLWAQPVAITFGHGSRLSGYSHFPDLMALFTDGSYGLLDVRPAERGGVRAGQTFPPLFW